MIEIKDSEVVNNKIKQIVDDLEHRITYLMNKFIKLEEEATFILDGEITPDGEITNPKAIEKLNAMLDIFVELKPIERLIRFKYKEFIPVFDKLIQIEGERTYGKFFSFLACLPNKRKYIKKNPFIQKSLTGQSSLQ